MDGKVKFYNEKKGFGFIEVEGQDDLFFHVSEIQNNEELSDGDEIRFDVAEGQRGKKAVKVMKI